jgi:outer membrane protein
MKKERTAVTNLITLFVVAFLVCAGFTAEATATDLDADIVVVPEKELGAGHVFLGLGLGLAPDYEGSDDYGAVPLPLAGVRFDNHMYIIWAANRLQVNLIPSPTWRGGLTLQYIGKRDSDVHSKKVGDLDEVDASFMVGGFLGFETETWRGAIEAMADVADGNDGSIVRLKAGYKIPISKVWTCSINAFTTWADDDYIESYFGIDEANSVKSGLDTFKADSGIKDVGVTVPVLYSPWQHWGVLGVVSYKRLLGDAEDSPVVKDEGDENQFLGGALLLYKF